MPKKHSKKSSSSHHHQQLSQDMINNLINTNFPTPNFNTDSPTGSSSAQSNFLSQSQASGYGQGQYVPLLTNPYSSTFYQQNPQQAFYPFQQNFNPFQHTQPEIHDSSDDTTENVGVDEHVPETQPDDEAEPSTRPDSKGKRKQVRWTEEETRILCERWVHCSENGVIGRNQTEKSFWNNVLNDYNALVSEKRNYSQLNGKWNKIAPDVKKFNALYKKYSEQQPQSGASDNDVLKAARNFFAQNEFGRRFIYEACWEILRWYPKFFNEPGVMTNKRVLEADPQPIDLEAEAETVPNLPLNMENLFRPDPIRRPPGRKASKKSSSSDAATSSRTTSTEKSEAYEAVKRSAIAHTEAVQAIKQSTAKKLAFKALKFLSIQKKKTKKEIDLLMNARANVVDEYSSMFPPREPGPNDEAEAAALADDEDEDEDEAEDEE